MTPANEIRDALAATLAQSVSGGMTCMDTHDARAFLANRDQWKARADKAEAEVTRLREVGNTLLRILDEIDAYQRRPERGDWGVECACCMGKLLDDDRQAIAAARAALEVNDA